MRFCFFFALLLFCGVARADKKSADESGVQIQRDIAFAKRGGRALRLHLLRPAQLPTKPLPFVVWVHGGLWRGGSHDNIPPFLFQLARRGIAGASVEFRSTKEAPFPAQTDDVRAAIRFLRANSHAYSLDGAHIGLIGASTGAHLASLVGLGGGVEAVADICGPSDLTNIEKDSRLDWNEDEGPLRALLGGPAAQKMALARAASPLFQVSRSAPPFLILHGEDDSLVSPAQSEALFQKLKRAGGTVSYRLYRGEEHGLRGVASEVEGELIRFFGKWLATK
jgi:acetyl esterase/lipase